MGRDEMKMPAQMSDARRLPSGRPLVIFSDSAFRRMVAFGLGLRISLVLLWAAVVLAAKDYYKELGGPSLFALESDLF